MADRRIPTDGYYVYALLREDGKTPFYIGKGGGDRWLRHEKDAWKNRSHKDRVILKMRRNGIDPIPKVKLVEGITDRAAKKFERRMIKWFGRYPEGSLVNGTAGGDGVEALSPEALAKRNRSIQAAHSDPALREAARERRLAFLSDPENRRRSSEAHIEACNRPDEREKRRQRSLEMWQNAPAERKEKLRARHKTPEYRAAQAQKMKERWQDPEYKAKFLRRFDPDVIAKSSAKLKETFKDPEKRKMLSESGRKGAAARWGKP